MVKRFIEEVAPNTVTQLSMPPERGPETYAMVPQSRPEKLESSNSGPMACWYVSHQGAQRAGPGIHGHYVSRSRLRG